MEQKQIQIQHSSEGLEVYLSGPFTIGNRVSSDELFQEAEKKEASSIKIIDDGLAEWDSSLNALLLKLYRTANKHGMTMDMSNMPETIQSLIKLATAVPSHSSSPQKQPRPSLVSRIGQSTINGWNSIAIWLNYLGETAIALTRYIFGRARYRKVDFWLTIEACGPNALGIVTLISVMVGAILAFVGAIQLSIFGAEIYVANLVGVGMVMEMGALMTGIILAGRTGAAFAAQLGTMQVNEEIDALETMGISPMEYHVVPRIVSLAIMTPLLVIYSNVLGILGGAAVGIFALDIPSQLFFKQTFEMMTPFLCAQGLIKGATYGIIVALSGCLRGIQCGRSASAVGDAATSAVVTSIVGIVVADAIWTFIFMQGGGM